MLADAGIFVIVMRPRTILCLREKVISQRTENGFLHSHNNSKDHRTEALVSMYNLTVIVYSCCQVNAELHLDLDTIRRVETCG